MNELTIAGQNISITPLSNSEQKGLWLELIANFEIGRIEFNNMPMLILSQKAGANYSPTLLKKLSERIETVKGMPSVFYFDRLQTYERDRLVAQGVYFIVSDKYAFVPSLIINRMDSKLTAKDTFLPATQYIMLHHLQVASINGKSMKDLAAIIPYKYKTVAKSVKQLEQLGLLQLTGGKEKGIVIEPSNGELWNAVQPHLINPVKATYYGSKPLSMGAASGISALSHYSMLAPDDIPTIAITSGQFAELRRLDYPFHSFEDAMKIEIWKYPPLERAGFVDKLSLYLILKDDIDPRVQKELDTMISKMQW